MHFKIILPVYFVLFMSNVLCTVNVTVPNKTLWQSYIVFCLVELMLFFLFASLEQSDDVGQIDSLYAKRFCFLSQSLF